MSAGEKQVLVLSGASQGIGRALALAWAGPDRGMVLNARGTEALEQTATACREAGADVRAVAGSVADPQVAEAMGAAAAELGGADVVIHAAGVLAPGPAVHELSPDNFRAVADASFTGIYALMRAFVPQLRQREGVFVVFGSGAADIAQPGIGAYCAAKAAEEHLARQLAAEVPEVTTIIYRPGIVETRMQVDARGASGSQAQALHKVFQPWKDQGQLLTPEHSAKYLLRLLADNPRQYHGQTVRAQ